MMCMGKSLPACFFWWWLDPKDTGRLALSRLVCHSGSQPMWCLGWLMIFSVMVTHRSTEHFFVHIFKHSEAKENSCLTSNRHTHRSGALYQITHTCGCNVTLCTHTVCRQKEATSTPEWWRMVPGSLSFTKPCPHMWTSVVGAPLGQENYSKVTYVCHANCKSKQSKLLLINFLSIG